MSSTKSIKIPKKLKPWEDLVLEMRELVEEAKRHGESESDPYTTIFEDVTIKNERQYENYMHREIPELMRRILRFLRFQGIVIYHRKDDINTPEYLVAAMRGRIPYVFEIDIDYDDIGGRWELMWIRIVRNAEINKDYLPYYHEV
jgi:hypothetical protein